MIVDLRGQTFATAAELRDQLGDDITSELLRDWKRRGLLTAVRVGRVNLYPLAEVVEAELATRDRTKPRRPPRQDRRTALS